MKTLAITLSLLGFVLSNSSILAQEVFPVFDYGEAKFNNVDTIPDFQSQNQKLKITGTIYEDDGVTPAKDVLFYIEQADAYGDFDLRYKNDRRYVYHSAWVKTAKDGRYTFYAFMPGNDRRYNQLKQIFPIIKTSKGEVYVLDSFLFEDDPLLSKLCRKKIKKKGDSTRILKPRKIDKLLVVEKDIVLRQNLMYTK